MLSDSGSDSEWESHESGWPPSVLFLMQPERFIPPHGLEPYESLYYGAYTALLHHLFPIGSHFMVDPVPYPDPDILGNLLVNFIVLHLQPLVPVLLLKVKVAEGTEFPATRVKADEHVRGLLKRYGEACPLPRLRAFSIFGTKLCFYSREKDGEVIPTRATNESEVDDVDADVVPKEWWSLDVLEAEGANLIRQQVASMMEECSNLSAEEIAATPPFTFR